jgi:hypothetical protein
VLRSVYAAWAWYYLATTTSYRYFGGKRQNQNQVQTALLAHQDGNSVKSYQHFYIHDNSEPDEVVKYFEAGDKKIMAQLLERMSVFEEQVGGLVRKIQEQEETIEGLQQRGGKKRKIVNEDRQEVYSEIRRKVMALTKGRMTEDDKNAKFELALALWDENFEGEKPPYSFFTKVGVGKKTIGLYRPPALEARQRDGREEMEDEEEEKKE